MFHILRIRSLQSFSGLFSQAIQSLLNESCDINAKVSIRYADSRQSY